MKNTCFRTGRPPGNPCGLPVRRFRPSSFRSVGRAAIPATRSGFVLFFVCVFALMMMVLVFGLSTQKRGEIIQLGRTIEQERVVLFAEAGIAEMLAAVKAGANDRQHVIGKSVFQLWQSGAVSVPLVLKQVDYPVAQLPVANGLAAEYPGGQIKITGQVRLVLKDKITSTRPSYTGFVELVAKATARGIPDIKVKERRELKIADLSYPFLDKYALYVKSFCRLWNNPEKQIVIQGIKSKDRKQYSFVYLGNRSYPKSNEFPQGEKGAKTPPVLLDIYFKDDHHLLGSFYKPGAFQTKVARHGEASKGNLFYVLPPFKFTNIAQSFSVDTDFHNTPELVAVYQNIVNVARKYSSGSEQPKSLSDVIMQDYYASGQNPANSRTFKELIRDLMPRWQYQYGYTDYTSIIGDGAETFVNEQPFTGILQYFDHVFTENKQRAIGGKMPILFGTNRDTPVFVEGPVYLRFFKIAFFDQVTVPFSLDAYETMDVTFPPVPLNFENTPKTFAGKKCTPLIDERTDTLMSVPIHSLSINHLFFGTGKNVVSSPSVQGGSIAGHNVFPALDNTLRRVARVYETSGEFLQDRLRMVNGRKILDLDGESLILKPSGGSLDLTSVTEYRGQGRIIMAQGHCTLGSLKPMNAADSLRIYLMGGSFFVRGNEQNITIHASLAATTCFPNNASPVSSDEGSIHFGEKSLTIYGNLLVDNMAELKSLPSGGRLTIVHDPHIFAPEYPVRVSIGETKSLLAVDYHAS